MNRIDFNARQKISIEVPSCWDELTREQFIEVVNFLPELHAGSFSDGLLQILLTIDTTLFRKISAIQKYHIQQSFGFLKGKPEIENILIESFTVDNTEYVGFQPTFSNTTWEEFIYADQYFMNNQYLQAIAVLYRERKENYDWESDIRIPFSIYGTDRRLKKIQAPLNPPEGGKEAPLGPPERGKGRGLDSSTVAAIALNYQALRERHIVGKYTHVFASPPALSEGDRASFSWVQVHRNILSEYFFEEEKFLKSNVHAVLHRMNNLIEENRKRKNSR